MTLAQKPDNYIPTPSQLGHIYRQLELHYPHEAGGGLFLLENGEAALIPLLNTAEEAASSNRRRHHFEPNLTPFLKAFLKGNTLKILFHSHPDGADEMSFLDRNMAQYTDPDSQRNQPWYPGVGHLIVSVGNGAITLSSKLFMFCNKTNRFESIAVFDCDGHLTSQSTHT